MRGGSNRLSGKTSSKPKAAGSRKTTLAPQADMRSTVDIIVEESGPTRLPAVDWLAANGRYISGETLAVVIEANPGKPLPDRLRDYVCRFLRGKIKRKPGPKRAGAEFRFIVEFLAAQEYQKELRRLQKEPRIRGRKALARGILTPHEEAIKIIKERFRVRFAGVSPRRVANIISSRS